MLDSVLFTSYGLAVSAMGYNFAQIKFQDDFQRDIREYREYDYANETLKREKFDTTATKCVILAKYTREENELIEEMKEKTEGAENAEKEEGENVEKMESDESIANNNSKIRMKLTNEKDILFQRTITFFNITDPARLFQAKISKDEQFTLMFPVSEANPDHPLEVQFNPKSQTEFFDIETLSQSQGESAKTWRDALYKMYFVNFLKMDFGYIQKGITVNKKTGEGPELMVLGDMKFTGTKYLMQNPKMIIGTDRMELYEFYARRKEVLMNNNRQFLKLAAATTFVHFVIVRLPTLFSRQFGDDVSDIEKRIGAKDESEIGLRMSRAKNYQQRKEI